ncbi:M16 family metallopeptidase [Streptomyces monashensis]|uniref:Peptidase M16 n=1 Tax=Streptomyces monashensis TaxID=1678012 RepID=A0A1S2PZ43_9ACTN|nr:pitrilysin family protein [Streptomyces monashensis]OIJ99053.1 peptidase M16 [Streptomyces monashensis]
MPKTSPQRATLPNGLRVVAQSVPGVPAVGVAVHYGVGFRSEPYGRSGFAHLFEHMMFQGSRNVARGEHFSLVQGAGGVVNGSTYPDYTDYHQVVPAAALERVLFLEADRMASLDVTETNLNTQRNVVKEEIRLNVDNRPYGGFPWTVLPSVLYERWANAHNGYGDFVDLDRATVAECADFFAAHYVPGNAVLTLCGDIDPQQAIDAAARQFDAVPSRPAPTTVPLAEPRRPGPLRGTVHDPFAPRPATALGFRLPDPCTELDAYVAHMVLSTLLTAGEQAPLKQALAAMAVDVSSGCGLFGPLQARDPDTFIIVATHPPQVSSQQIAQSVDAALADITHGKVDEHDVARAVAITASRLLQTLDSLLARTRQMGARELLFGRPDLGATLPDLAAGITTSQVIAAAAQLREQQPALLSLLAEGGNR